MVKKRILFGASYSVIEPLGLLHLGGLARDEGWEREYALVKDHDYGSFFEIIKDFKPGIVGFNVYTGNHRQLHESFERLRKDYPHITTVVGGPHPTYFPSESARIADFAVMSEGFGALRKILKGTAEKGIMAMEGNETFPHPDRKKFYESYPEHGRSRIKSFITMTGCPYKCTYCYNSSEPEDISAPQAIIQKIRRELSLSVLGDKKPKTSSRLFPLNVRSVDDVLSEVSEIVKIWPTEVLYCQDDVHGFDLNHWMPALAKRWNKEVGIPYHAQMRWEMTKEEKRLDLLKEAGCFGLTLAIEAADFIIRDEVLNRAMPEDIMFKGMKAVIDRGFKVRTEQITALPYGATSKRTEVNLNADLQLVELNVRLKEKTEGPSMAWASTLAPYKGTKLGIYCEKFGHYKGDNSDVPDTFFDRSVLRFPKEWIGPSLEDRKNDSQIWLKAEDLERYRGQNAELRRNFNFFTSIPQGHKLAENYLKSREEFSYKRLGVETRSHLESLAIGNRAAQEILSVLPEVEEKLRELIVDDSENFALNRDFYDLLPVFASLPRGELALERAMKYHLIKDMNCRLRPDTLSTAIRHHLYEEVLYNTGNNSFGERKPISERYPPKL